MAYLKCTPINRSIVTESITTMGKQLWYGIKSIFDADTYFDDDEAFRKYMDNKREQFDQYFKLSPVLQRKLEGWIKKIPDVLLLSPSEMRQFLSASNSEQRYTGSTTDGSGYASSYEYNERNEVSTQRKARRSNGFNSFTNATCSYLLPIGGKQALLFFTFDSDEIKVAQVITRNKYSSGGMSSGIQAVKIPEWNTVQPVEYLR